MLSTNGASRRVLEKAGLRVDREVAHGDHVEVIYVASMGALFVILGGAAFVLPTSAHTLLLGAGFGGLHLISGILIGRINHGD